MKNSSYLTNYYAKSGETVKILKNQIRKKMNSEEKNEIKKPLQRVQNFKQGKFHHSDFKYAIWGMDLLEKLGNKGVDKSLREMSQKENITLEEIKKAITTAMAQGPIIQGIRVAQRLAQSEYTIQREKAHTQYMNEIIQNSRDGIITKKQQRIEKDEQGKERIVNYDTSMTEEEILGIIRDYSRALYEIQEEKVPTYIGLGMNIFGVLGEMYEAITKEENTGRAVTLGIGTCANVGALLGRRYITKDYGKKVGQIRRKIDTIKMDLAKNEPISAIDEEIKLEEIKEELSRLKVEEDKIEIKASTIKEINLIVQSLLLGSIAAKEMQKKKELTGSTISQVLMEITHHKRLIDSIADEVDSVNRINAKENQLTFLEEELKNIVKQIEEKQDPLEEVKHPIQKLQIRDLEGKFYPQKNDETGKITYQHKINIPEFSAQTGEVVLLTGESGKGKSTLIRLLKKGDINNRYAIEVDDTEKVDKLGKQFIQLKANSTIDPNTNVLKQITGKESISELTEEEQKRLEKVLGDVSLNEENAMQNLATRNYSQFSTGQQKRLVLAQRFYQMIHPVSVLLADEPADNVEKALMEEQFKVIQEYTKKKGMITILVTHRPELAEPYVDKKYYIGPDQVLREVTLKDKEKETKENIELN